MGKRVNVAVVGFGVVGSGVVDLLQRNRDLINSRAEINLNLKYVVDKDLKRDRGVKILYAEFTDDVKKVLEDPEVDIIVELIGGTTFAFELIKTALEKGKHVVTANKALLAEKGIELFKLAQEKSLYIGFEASVAGGIPIIRTIGEALIGDRIIGICGIVNGTTNFILTKMLEEDMDFESALKLAQKLGFAEADPTLDIDGHDAAHKTAILATLAFSTPVTYYDVYVEGIRGMDLRDIYYARSLGYIPKLLSIIKKDDNGEIEVRVHPTFIPEKSQLASVREEYNAVLVHSEFLGISMYYGKGAGSRPTATAVVSDIVDIAKMVTLGYKTYNHTVKLERNAKIKPMDETINRYYIRFMTEDKPGILSKISGVLGDLDISIASVIQKETKAEVVPVVMTTHEAKEKKIKSAMEKIEKMPFIKEKPVVYRILESV